MAFHVDSEVGRLRQVIVHRPGLELARLTPSNVDELLFDDVMWAQRAREEHDAFVAEAARPGRRRSTTTPTCSPRRSTTPGAREFVLERARQRAHVGPALVAPLRRDARLARRRRRWPTFLIGGILKKDLQLPAPVRACCWSTSTTTTSSSRPLPNHLFQRDNSAWVYDGRVDQPDGEAGPQARDHPLAGRSTTSTRCSRPSATLHFYYGNDDRPHEPATCEGGDILVIGNGAVMIGMGERTTPQGIETLASSCSPQRRGRPGHRRRAAARRGRSCTWTPR